MTFLESSASLFPGGALDTPGFNPLTPLPSPSDTLLTASSVGSSPEPDRVGWGDDIFILSTTDPGNSLDTALNLGVLTGVQSFEEGVSPRDQFDVYQFRLADPTSFSASLTNLSADADLYLVRDLNNNQSVESNEVVGASERFGQSSETINLASLASGDYFLFVAQYSGSTNYSLSLSIGISQNTSNPDDALFDPLLGFGLVNASAAVAEAIGQPQAFADIPNPTSSVASNFTDLSLINVPEVWAQGFTGEGVVVAVLDTGVDISHPDLINNIWVNEGEIPGNGQDDDGNGYVDDVNGWDFGDRDNSPLPGRERGSEHGTHVAGTIGASRDGIDLDARGNRVEVQGVAPDAMILPVRVLGGRFGSTNNALALGIRYAVDNGADVINLSLGSANDSEVLMDALQYAEERGVVIVAAAGNEASQGASVPLFPAREAALTDFGIAVGAVNRQLDLASFSNPAGTTLGEYPFVLAPGVQVLSTVPNNRYGVLSGTSMATPHVAGVVALILDANPELTPEEVENILIATADSSGITA